jgi:uncharacterized membrane protein YdjX (TVP38/TMEM64 family)
MIRTSALEQPIAFVLRYKRLLGVVFFLAFLLVIFEASGLREHFNLQFIRQLILRHRIEGLALFVLLFSLGNLVHVPGLVFLAAAVVALDRLWGGIVTYAAAVTSWIPIAMYCIFFDFLATGLHVR